MIEKAYYRLGEALGLPVWCQDDEGGPYQAIPQGGPLGNLKDGLLLGPISSTSEEGRPSCLPSCARLQVSCALSR
jgi:hypothetical protein